MRRAPLAAVLILAVLGVGTAIAAERPPRTFFGVGPQSAIGPSDVARMGIGGIGTLRLEFPWAKADPLAPAGDFDWTEFDPVVGEAAQAGIRILPVFYETPAWVPGLDGHACASMCPYFLPTGDLGLGAWREYVAAAVARYGPGGSFWLDNPSIPPRPIRAWQIWNEQNSGQYALPQPTVRPYARMVSSAARAIRSVDPTGKVILGGMFGNPISIVVPGLPAESFLKRFYRRGGIENRFEGIAVHPYSGAFGGVSDQVEALRRVAEAAGDAKAETWITEIGWASGGAVHPLNVGELGQAAMLERAYDLFMAKRKLWRVKLISWFSWRDSSGAPICLWCPDSGLFDAAHGLQPKPAWHAFVRFTGGS